MWWAIGTKIKTYAYGAVGLTVVAMAFILVYYKHKSEIQATELKKRDIMILQYEDNKQKNEIAFNEQRKRIEQEYLKYAKAKKEIDKLAVSNCDNSPIPDDMVKFMFNEMHNNK